MLLLHISGAISFFGWTEHSEYTKDFLFYFYLRTNKKVKDNLRDNGIC